MSIYSYYGKCEQRYFGLFEADNDLMAIRIIQQALAKDEKLALYSSEYSLYCLCDFDNDTGVVSSSLVRFVSDFDKILLDYISYQKSRSEGLKLVSGISDSDVDAEEKVSL